MTTNQIFVYIYVYLAKE